MPAKRSWPAYVALLESGELARRAEKALRALESCQLCPRICGVNRIKDERGECKTGFLAKVSSAHLHFGEEEPLVGYGGSGTIFFSHCNLSCQFCQNYEISQHGEGSEVDVESLAGLMLRLQQGGAHNINLVSPSHVIAQFLGALVLAAEAGLRLPIVYNTGGYDSLTSLRLLDGVIDIYMPDAKYASRDIAKLYSQADHYPRVNRNAIREMHRQVGDLEVDSRGIARRGLIVRHLVLPAGLAGTNEVMKFLAEKVSTGTYVNVMAQYRPCYRANDSEALGRTLRWSDFKEAVRIARSHGLHRLAR